MITTTVVTVGTAGTLAVSPTVDAQKVWIENLEPEGNIGDFSREGYAYLVDQIFTVASLATLRFSFTTGATGAQFDYWNIVSTNDNIIAKLYESATITTSGTVIPAYNMNRNAADDYEAVLETASALTGGTVIAQELVNADKEAGGGQASSKVITLAPNTEYGFTFYNSGNQSTDVHFQLIFVEFYNGYNDIWINGLHGQTVRLKGGDKVQFQLEQAEGLWASSIRNGTRLAIMRQD